MATHGSLSGSATPGKHSRPAASGGSPGTHSASWKRRPLGHSLSVALQRPSASQKPGWPSSVQAAAAILAVSRAIGETMIVAIAAGQQPRLTFDPRVPVETMTAYIVQVSLGDTPAGTLEYRTIFAVGMLLFVSTFTLNLLSNWLRNRFREEYA